MLLCWALRREGRPFSEILCLLYGEEMAWMDDACMACVLRVGRLRHWMVKHSPWMFVLPSYSPARLWEMQNIEPQLLFIFPEKGFLHVCVRGQGICAGSGVPSCGHTNWGWFQVPLLSTLYCIQRQSLLFSLTWLFGCLSSQPTPGIPCVCFPLTTATEIPKNQSIVLTPAWQSASLMDYPFSPDFWILNIIHNSFRIISVCSKKYVVA